MNVDDGGDKARPAKLDYAPPPRRTPARWSSRHGWYCVFGGSAAGIGGLMLAIAIDELSLRNTWLLEILVGVLAFGGVVLCVTGIVVVALAAAQPE